MVVESLSGVCLSLFSILRFNYTYFMDQPFQTPIAILRGLWYLPLFHLSSPLTKASITALVSCCRNSFDLKLHIPVPRFPIRFRFRFRHWRGLRFRFRLESETRFQFQVTTHEAFLCRSPFVAWHFSNLLWEKEWRWRMASGGCKLEGIGIRIRIRTTGIPEKRVEKRESRQQTAPAHAFN